MGIERFFSSIEENDIANKKSQFTTVHNSKLKSKYFMIDFNSIIHITSFYVISDLNYVLYKIITKDLDDKSADVSSKYQLDTTNIKSYIKDKTYDRLNEIIIDEVIFNVLDLLDTYMDPSKIELLYIAIDGVPSKAKIIEQKKRRYMGSVFSEIKKIIFDKHVKSIKKEKDRYLYETNKISWNKNSISPGTIFLDDMYRNLTNSIFRVKIMKKCKNIKKYICSGPYEPGEGEMKIVDYLRNNSLEGSCTIFSPDSDVTLLALLLNNELSPINKHRITPLNVLRHNQQKGIYNVIDIDMLALNMYSYVSKHIEKKISKTNTIDDIVLILTVFGDDFLPKIESLNVKYDFSKLIDKYISVHKKVGPIIKYNKHKNIKYIDNKAFAELIKSLQMDEGGNLQKNYIASHYNNYNRLKSVLDTTHDDFTKDMNIFLDKIRKFNGDIQKIDSLKTIEGKWSSEKNFIKI